MGILKHLLGWPVTGPKALLDFSLRRIHGVALREMTDDEVVKEDLLELQLLLELGDIDEEEYQTREAELMDELRRRRELRTELGMEEAWAPVGFSGEGDESGGGMSAEIGTDEEAEWSDDDSSDSSTPDSSSS